MFNKMTNKKLTKDIKFELWKVNSIRYSICFILLLILMTLLWNWQYHLAFWVILLLTIADYAPIVYKMNKLEREIF